ncbi:hypothetical protein Tco_1284255 [Tanacetum coccineum]
MVMEVICKGVVDFDVWEGVGTCVVVLCEGIEERDMLVETDYSLFNGVGGFGYGGEKRGGSVLVISGGIGDGNLVVLTVVVVEGRWRKEGLWCGRFLVGVWEMEEAVWGGCFWRLKILVGEGEGVGVGEVMGGFLSVARLVVRVLKIVGGRGNGKGEGIVSGFQSGEGDFYGECREGIDWDRFLVGVVSYLCGGWAGLVVVSGRKVVSLGCGSIDSFWYSLVGYSGGGVYWLWVYDLAVMGDTECGMWWKRGGGWEGSRIQDGGSSWGGEVKGDFVVGMKNMIICSFIDLIALLGFCMLFGRMFGFVGCCDWGVTGRNIGRIGENFGFKLEGQRSFGDGESSKVAREKGGYGARGYGGLGVERSVSWDRAQYCELFGGGESMVRASEAVDTFRGSSVVMGKNVGWGYMGENAEYMKEWDGGREIFVLRAGGKGLVAVCVEALRGLGCGLGFDRGVDIFGWKNDVRCRVKMACWVDFDDIRGSGGMGGDWMGSGVVRVDRRIILGGVEERGFGFFGGVEKGVLLIRGMDVCKGGEWVGVVMPLRDRGMVGRVGGVNNVVVRVMGKGAGWGFEWGSGLMCRAVGKVDRCRGAGEGWSSKWHIRAYKSGVLINSGGSGKMLDIGISVGIGYCGSFCVLESG